MSKSYWHRSSWYQVSCRRFPRSACCPTRAVRCRHRKSECGCRNGLRYRAYCRHSGPSQVRGRECFPGHPKIESALKNRPQLKTSARYPIKAGRQMRDERFAMPGGAQAGPRKSARKPWQGKPLRAVEAGRSAKAKGGRRPRPAQGNRGGPSPAVRKPSEFCAINGQSAGPATPSGPFAGHINASSGSNAAHRALFVD